MILFNIKKLEQRLINRGLSDKEKFNYFFIPTIITYLLAFKSKETTKDEFLFLNIEHGIYAFVYIVVLYTLFTKCKKANVGSRFFELYFSLWFVSFIRAAVFSIPFFILFGIIFTASPSWYEAIENYDTIISTGMIVLLFYYFLITSFSNVLKELNS